MMTFCALLAFAGGASADDMFSVDDVTLPVNGEVDVVVRYSLDEGSTCSGYNFWLQVPEKLAFVTYVKNEEERVTYTAGNCYDEMPTITPNIDGGYLKVACITANSDPLNKQSGTLVIFRIKTNSAVSVGDTFIGTLTGGTISEENGTIHNVADKTFTITIGESLDPRMLLDENSTTFPETATDVDVRVRRTIKANEWSTICLPFAMGEAQVKAAFGGDVQLADFIDYVYDDEAGRITVNFAKVTEMEANHPYIIKVKSKVEEFTVDGVDVDLEDNPCVEYDNGLTGKKRKVYGTFAGTYVADFDFYNEAEHYPLFLSDNKFYYATENTRHMKAFRAYFDFEDNLPEAEEAASRIIMLFNGETTGISDIRCKKEDIICDVYDLQGRKVQKPVKGLYIKNGRKEIVK